MKEKYKLNHLGRFAFVPNTLFLNVMAIGKDVPTVIARQTNAYEMPITNVKAKTSLRSIEKNRSDLLKYNSKSVMFEA